MSQQNSAHLELVVTGKLPPSSGHSKRRPGTGTGTGTRTRRSKHSIKQEPITLRPQSVPVTPLWDDTPPLAVQSTPIPLSSRSVSSIRSSSSSSSLSKHIHRAASIPLPYYPPSSQQARRTPTPSTASGRHRQSPERRREPPATTQDSIKVPPLSRRRQHPERATKTMERVDMLTDSVDQLSLEVDDILSGIRNGSYLSSPERVNSKVHRQATLPVNEEQEEERNWSNHYHASDEDVEEEGANLVRHEVEVTAATRLQRWYRKERERKEKVRVQSLLEEKRDELNQSREERERKALDEVESRAKQEADRLQRRAARLQANRKAAIESLRKKREEKKLTAERVAQEEMAMLEASGKVKKPNSTQKTKRIPKIAATLGSSSDPPHPVSGDTADVTQPVVSTQPADGDGITQPAAVSGDVKEGQSENPKSPPPPALLEEFFQAGPRKLPPQSPTKAPAPSSPQHKPSTMDNIFHTLQQLEEAPPPLPGPPTSATDNIGYLSATNLHRMMDDTTAYQSRLSDSKLHTILSYLDQVEKGDEENVRPPASARQEEPRRDDIQLAQQMQAASVVATDVTSTIMSQRLDIENKKKTIEMLQKALTHQRELTIYHTKEMEKDAQKRLELQRQEYETTVQRHQCFIDQLIEDKKVLSEKCEVLVKELRETNSKYKNKIRTMEDTHTAVMEKQRQTAAASDKLKRERWKSEETRRIKEATVKSLEPEIQRIIAKGKAEIQKLKAFHEAELLQSDERASRKFLQQTEELRTQLAQEKELACTHERELARQKYEQLAEQEERSYQQLRRKLYTELQQERDKAAQETLSQQQLMEGRLQEMKESHAALLERMKTEHEAKIAEMQRRHQTEVREVGERAAIEKTSWEEHYMKRQEGMLLGREREMREKLRRERDAEIETVIQRLEHETATTKEECEKAAESRVRRIREKCETELREVERSERNTLQKFNAMKCQLTEREGDVTRLRTLLRQREQEVEEVNEVASRLSRERDRVTEIVRQEFADRLIAIEEENRQVKIDMSELKARHKAELERMARGKERELEEVHERVKQALAKKEGNLRSMRGQHEAALKRAEHLEMLLEQQRKELLNR